MLKVKLHVPVHRSVEAGTVMCLLKLCEYELKRGRVRLEFEFLVGESLISRGRNTIAHSFLESDNDYLLMIDSDIIFPENLLEKLLERDKPLIGVNYLHKCGEIRRAGVCENDFEDLSEASHLATGCLLVKRWVFEQLVKRLDLGVYDTSVQVGVKGFFVPYISDDGVYLSEDWAFSQRCKDAGIKMWMDNTIKLGHIGTKVYREVV